MLLLLLLVLLLTHVRFIQVQEVLFPSLVLKVSIPREVVERLTQKDPPVVSGLHPLLSMKAPPILISKVVLDQ